jgi:hypothetical protein
MTTLPITAMDTFPCARLTSPFYSIGSNPSLNSHEYDAVFAKVLERGAAIDSRNASKVNRCEVKLSTLEAWLLELVRPLGNSRLLGPVPMNIHGLRFSPSCISLGEGRPFVSRVEFVVHRYGDAQGVHYSCLVSTKLPYKLYAYKLVGTVPAGMLWSVSQELS